MQTLSDIRALLEQFGLRPNKRFGQNFLHDQNKIRAILDAADLKEGDVVLEVGPGTGALTEALLDTGARVVAVEIDTQLIPLLRHALGDDRENFHLLHADVLENKRTINPAVLDAVDDFLQHAGSERRRSEGPDQDAPSSRGFPEFREFRGFHLIANLPYNIASPLIATLATDHAFPKSQISNLKSQIASALIMVQREVADRLTADPGGKTFGPLTVMVQNAFHTDTVMTLPPGCFYPPPSVHSAVVRLTRRDVPLTTDTDALGAMAQTLFQKRRKQLGSILGRDFPFPTDIDPDARPETLTVAQIVQLAAV